MNAIHHVDHIGPGLALHIQQNGGLPIGPGRQPGVFGGDDSLRNIRQSQWRVVAIRDDEIHVLIG